jgi:FkbM family methyltransferase
MFGIKTRIKSFIKRFIGKKATVKNQPFFERKYYSAIAGMNIGGGSDCSNSGELNVLKYIFNKREQQNKIIIFDVGANVGNYSKMVYETSRKKAGIYSFEPSKIAYKKMVENTMNIPNIKSYNFGFGENNAELTLYTNEDGSGLASIYKRRLDHFNINMDKKENVKIKTIDSFCEENKIEKIDFLKLDVEGHELKVLTGAKNLKNTGKIRFIQFEFGGCNIDSRTYFQDFWYMLKDKYKIYRIINDGLYEIKEYKEIYECFITTNFFAEKK